MDELQKVLHSQEHSQNLIQEAIPKVTSFCIEDSRGEKAKTDSDDLGFVATFSPNNENLLPLIQTALKSLQQSHENKECLKDIMLIKRQRQTSGLKKPLTRAKYSSNEEYYSKKCS